MLDLPYIVIDAGNSSIKVGLFEKNELKQVKHLLDADIVKLCNQEQHSPIIVSSVGKDVYHLLNLIVNKKRVLVLDHHTKIPLVNHYETPHTLGVDRLAGCIGAKGVFPSDTCLVIDIGTCITYDLIDAQNHYHGGAISLGLKMRFKALNNFTAKLPLVDNDGIPPLIGASTIESIQSGVINGMAAELNGIIARYTNEFSGLRVLICGGDAIFFETSIKHPIFARPDLVLTGLYRILLYNELEINK